MKNINKAIDLNPSDELSYVARALIYIFNENKEDNYLAKNDLYKAVEMGSIQAKNIIAEYYNVDVDEEEEDPN